MPAEDLEILSQRLQSALDVDPSSPVPALQALLRREVRKRSEGGRA